MFRFRGSLDISKSWMNRALILRSLRPQIKIIGASRAADVLLLQKALEILKDGGTQFYAGLGGTTFRFLAFRVARETGEFFIEADAHLLLRPQDEIVSALQQLGVEARRHERGLFIRSTGWREPKGPLKISVNESSQFISGIVLSSVDLSFDLRIELAGEIRSEDYLRYTLDLAAQCGLHVRYEGRTIQIFRAQPRVDPARDNPLSHESPRGNAMSGHDRGTESDSLLGEIDVSSAFSLIAAGLLAGDVEIENWSPQSLQPDMAFRKAFASMKIPFYETESKFQIRQVTNFQALNFNLANCPDLFPVLAVLCAFAEGESLLFGAPQLKHKESDRIVKTAELLEMCGVRVAPRDDGMIIQGRPEMMILSGERGTNPALRFDPAHDHRMAMAAALMSLKGFPITITEPQVIEKSFPSFYRLIGLQ